MELRIRVILVISFLFLFSLAYCQENNLDGIISGAINYLDKAQVKESNYPFAFRGEWKCVFENRKKSRFLGNKGERFYDSNCFVTASIHNILAEVYLNHKNYDQIPSMLERSMQNILQFEKDGSFNFWHILPIQSGKKVVFKRGSNGVSYPSQFLRNQFNIVNDADDTAAGLRAIRLYNRVETMNDREHCQLREPNSVHAYFNVFRDVNRTKINLYNVLQKRGQNTGLYLTWLGEDHHRIIFRPNKSAPNLPLGVNDIDCVVNANVLVALAEYNELSAVDQTVVDYLKAIVMQGYCNQCEIYYPTPYSFHYSLSKAIVKGLPFEYYLNDLIVDELLIDQNEDGSWNGYKKEDNLQATLFAAIALMNLEQRTSYSVNAAIDQGIEYILRARIQNNETCYWNEGVFFSLGGFTADLQLWKSEAYTTALAIEALTNYHKHAEINQELVSE